MPRNDRQGSGANSGVQKGTQINSSSAAVGSPNANLSRPGVGANRHDKTRQPFVVQTK